jgi:acetoin utilization deacetylase AcuC-like enzyme
MPTGIFFHYQQGERLRDFPQALEGILNKENVFFFDALYPSKPESSFDLDPIPIETLQKVHTPEMVQSVKATPAYDGALYSAAGTLSAAIRISSGEITNAFVFTGYGDHHAGSDFFGGGCCFNGAAIAIHELQEKFGIERFAIIDTDAHHGDGTWELFARRADVLYICFCTGESSECNRNVNIHVPGRMTDDGYLSLAVDAFNKWVMPFCPEILFWNWGYDGTVGEYGDMGLSPELHGRLALEIRKTAEVVCGGRLIVVLCGGSRRDLATALIPKVIETLAS